jgi:DNA-binding transcriptional ArsR family regulator
VNRRMDDSAPRGRQEAADPNLVKALSHPLRWMILQQIVKGTPTPAAIARRLGLRTENVSYHVRVLADLGIIELVETVPVRGALEHHYRALHRAFLSDADMALMPFTVRRDVLQSFLRTVIEDLGRATADGARFSRAAPRLDEQGYDEVVELLNGALDRLMEIQAESLARMDGDETDEIRSVVVLMHHLALSPAGESDVSPR